MGQQIPNVLGRNQKFYARREDTYGTSVTIATSDSITVLNSTIIARNDLMSRKDARLTAGSTYQTPGRLDGAWSVEAILSSAGVATNPGTTPPTHPLLFAAFGFLSFGNGVCSYRPSELQNSVPYPGSGDLISGPSSLTIVREHNGVASQQISGAAVNKVTIEIAAGTDSKIKFAGPFSSIIDTMSAPLTAPSSSGTVTLTIASSDSYLFCSGSKITVGSDNNGGNGYTVVASIAGTITLLTALTQNASSGATITPFVPSFTASPGTPAGSLVGQVRFNSVKVPVCSAKLTFDNQLKTHSDEMFNVNNPDFVPGFRNLHIEVVAKAQRGTMFSVGTYQQIVGTRVPLLMSNVNQGGFGISMSSSLTVESVDLDIPGSDVGFFKLSGRLMGTTLTSTSGDDFLLNFF